MNRDDIYYNAMRTRDPRFDGKFFVGVKTTGIYCRPICPAKPKRENVEFFSHALQAEKSGYRPCMRCRPESAPMSPAWLGKSAVVQRALKVLHAQEMRDFNEDQFAEKFGVSARHLRRLFMDEIGKTPKQLSFENRLNLARQLIVETSLSMTDIAFASGFSSIRRFNDAFRERFKKAPRDFRRGKILKNEALRVSLSYRPPFDFQGLLQSYENHRVGRLEWFGDGKMHRVISSGRHCGVVTIEDDAKNSELIVSIDFPDTSIIQGVIYRVRALFDLDSDPVLVANAIETDKDLKKILKSYPGIRLPSGWDPFEIAISAILGQLVSVPMGRMLVHDLIEIAGTESKFEKDGKKIKLFPTAQQILDADLKALKTTGRRKQTLRDFCQAVLEGEISLEPAQDVEVFIQKIRRIKGVGPWTANYIAMKALRSTDTFPDSDLILARAMEVHSQDVIDKMSPWRGYVAALLWRNYSESLKKTKKGKTL